jgi:FkbM family methyltransferase
MAPTDVTNDKQVQPTDRAAFFDRAATLTPLLAVDAHGARYLVSTADRHVSRSLFAKSARGDMRALSRAVGVLNVLNPGTVRDGTFIDVGANIGTTSIDAVLSHPFTRAVACEPEPRNLSLLELNVLANSLEETVIVCPAAIGEADGELELFVSEGKYGLPEVVSDRPPGWAGESETISVPQLTLDRVCSDYGVTPGDVDLIWMDVQGYEAYVLAGASSLTRLGTPAALELDPVALNRHHSLERLLDITGEYYTHYVSLRRVRGRLSHKFDLIPIADLLDEIKWLIENHRFTDVLFVRDPPARPRRGGIRLEAYASRPARVVDDASANSAVPKQSLATGVPDRGRLAAEAATFTPYLGAETGDATFVLPTRGNSDDLSLFLEGSDPRLRALDAVMAILDELGQGDQARRHGFLDLAAGIGVGAVAALRWHGFDRAVACEEDPETFAVLRLNLALNGLGDTVHVVEALAELEPRLGDDLLPAGPGLIWAENGALAAMAASFDAACPVVIGTASGPDLAALERTHTHAVVLQPGASADAEIERGPIQTLGETRPAEGAHVLALRLD